ncbi:hypothetical protein ABKV19_021609 [Rosa sericea]
MSVRGNTIVQPVSDPSIDGTRWQTNEDIQLCKSWRAVSQDPSKGTERRKDDLWIDVRQHYAEHWDGYVRSLQAFQGRWKTLKVELYAWHCALRQAKSWYKSGANMIDERRQAQDLWRAAMTKSKGKPKKGDFISLECYEIVKGFQQFDDIPNHSSSAGGTSRGGTERMHTQQYVPDSHVQLDIDADEVNADATPNPSVRPQGKKAAKEALRKGKKASNDSIPLTSAMETIATNQTSMLSAKEKRDEEYARHLRDQQQRDYIRLQLDIQEREFKIQEREERIMEMDTSKMTPTKKNYWQRKQNKIAEKEAEDATRGSNIPQPPFTGGYYPQPPFPGGYPQPPFLGGYYPQSHFPGGYYPQPPFPGGYPQPPFTGGVPSPPFSSGESTNPNHMDDPTNTNWIPNEDED